MSNLLQNSMSEATRLTNEGRLAEATAAIQRALGGMHTPVASEDTDRPFGPTRILWRHRDRDPSQGALDSGGRLGEPPLFCEARGLRHAVLQQVTHTKCFSSLLYVD